MKVIVWTRQAFLSSIKRSKSEQQQFRKNGGGGPEIPQLACP